MAAESRFPSIEDIDEGATGTGNGDADFDFMNDSNEGGDFLARERAALGEDADQFATPHDNVPSVSVQNGDGDLLGGSDAKVNGTDLDDFQTSFPAIDTRNEAVAPGGTITGSTSPFLPGARATQRPYSPALSASYAPEDEPEVIKEWRERQSLQIQGREEAAARRKEETIKSAREAIDEFYENYNNKREKNIAQTKKDAEAFLNNREDTAAGGTSWDRIAKLTDVRGGGKAQAAAAGKERMRDLLGNLSKDENAPGAKGY